MKKSRLIGVLLSLVMVLGLIPELSLTVYADDTTYNPASTYTGFSALIANDTEVTISEVSGKTWYVIANDSSTVTLLSKESFENKAFNSSGTGNDYATSEIKTYVDGLTGEGQPLAGISSVISDLTLIDITTAQGLTETKRKGAGTDWWLCSPDDPGMAAFVDGGSGVVYAYRNVGASLGVRPALKLNLSFVIFDSESKTFSLNPASTYTGFGALIANDTEVTISEVSGKTWYVIASDSSTVTLLSKESFENKAFNSSGRGTDYATSEIKTYVDGLTGEGQPLAGISSVISDLTLIDITTAQGLTETKRKGAGTTWWLCSPGVGESVACVIGGSGDVYDRGNGVGGPLGVRPALKLNLSSVIFDSESKTFSLNPASTYTGFSALIANDTEVTISEVSGKTWYVIANDSSTVTLLSKESFENKAFNSSGTGNDYATSEIKTYVDGLTGEGQPLAGISSVISDLTLIDITTAQGLTETKRKGAGTGWWLRSPGGDYRSAACVDGGSGAVYASGSDVTDTRGVRPALKLNLSSVIFSSESNTFTLKPSHTHNNITFVPWTDELAAQQNGEGKTAANSLPSLEGSYYLTKNVEVSAGSNEGAWTIYNNINLCLNGYSITRTNDGPVIMLDVDKDAIDWYDQIENYYPTLNLFDEEGDLGKITHAKDFDGEGVDVWNGTFNMYGGSISGNTSPEGFVGGVYIPDGDTFNMYGGKITGNSGMAGGVYIGGSYRGFSGSTFNMYGGEISGNTADSGGGVRIGYEGVFNMTGGEISGNTAAEYGGGVYSAGGYKSSAFNMSSGKVSGNKAGEAGGGVYFGDPYYYGGSYNDTYTFTLTGGEISDNVVTNTSTKNDDMLPDAGGGVFLNQGTFNLSGAPTISGNKLGEGNDAVDNNVYLCTEYDTKITLADALTYTTPIGVTTGSADKDFTSGWSTEMSGATPTAYFTSDDPGYTVVKVESGELQLAPSQTHTHYFTSYTASGATIAAACTAAGCTLPPSTDGGSDHVATLTISANGGTYVGTTAYGATITDDNGIQGEAKVQYQKKTGDSYGTATETAPTDAGDYKASITVGGVTASVEYTIAPAVIDAVTVTGIDAPVAATALDTAATLNTEHVTLRNSNAITWVPAAPQDGLAAYATAYKAAVTADADTNYAFSDAVAATVNGQTADVTENQDGSVEISLTFSKTALTPVTISAADQEVGYSRDGVSIPVQGMFTVPEGAGAATYSVTEGTGAGRYDEQSGKLSVTKCGTFTVSVKTAATDTHSAGAASATLTVNKAEATVTPPTARTLIFNGSAQDLVVSGSTEDGTVLYAVTTEDTQSAPESFFKTIPSATDMGTYYVWYKVQGDDNHNDTTAEKLEVTINAPAFGTPDFIVPGGVKTIGDNAFEGASMEIVWIPDGCNAIGAEAFKNCENLEQISIPRNCAIGTGAFEGCGTVFIFAPTGSKAESYCSTSTDCVFIADNRK